jgi:hypothetical protein
MGTHGCVEDVWVASQVACVLLTNVDGAAAAIVFEAKLEVPFPWLPQAVNSQQVYYTWVSNPRSIALHSLLLNYEKHELFIERSPE